MSATVQGKVQVGLSGTSSNNFHWRNLLDGLLRLSRGSHDAPSPVDVMTVNADNSVSFPGNVASGVLGTGQTWQNLTASRAAGVIYTNTTGRPIFVSVRESGDGTKSLTVDGLAVAHGSGTSYDATLATIVPNNSTYSFSGAFNFWGELR